MWSVTFAIHTGNCPNLLYIDISPHSSYCCLLVDCSLGSGVSWPNGLAYRTQVLVLCMTVPILYTDKPHERTMVPLTAPDPLVGIRTHYSELVRVQYKY